jgi:tRNA pseudouridine55 synthase
MVTKRALRSISMPCLASLYTIHQLDFLDYENGIISLEVSCSKGTYIRSLIADIGDKLGCGIPRKMAFSSNILTKLSA